MLKTLVSKVAVKQKAVLKSFLKPKAVFLIVLVNFKPNKYVYA